MKAMLIFGATADALKHEIYYNYTKNNILTENVLQDNKTGLFYHKILLQYCSLYITINSPHEIF